MFRSKVWITALGIAGLMLLFSVQPANAGRKQIVVSLSKQHLWAYEGNRVMLETPVTTGRPQAPTPRGQYRVLAKYTPYLFRSPYPPGHSLYYSPLWSNYSLRITWRGHHLHDSPWRTAYGPGTNTARHRGADGVVRAGSIGCVNIPPSVMDRLYSWADVGTLVRII